MAMHGKQYRAAQEKIAPQTIFGLKEGLARVKELAFAKFDESIDVNIKLGIDPSQGDQVVRGSVVLPFSIGKKARVIVFAKGDHAEEAREAGADVIGTDDLIQKIEDGWLDFDYAVATPDLMGAVGRLAKILGPKGLLPNKKVGTVTFEVGPIVTDLKKGRMFFKNDKSGLIHFSIGKKSQDVEQLFQNLVTFLKALAGSKPPASKGKFIQKTVLSSTMGVGVQVNPDEVVNS